ncbi:MAG: hypothetical protein H7Z10_08280, partial [Gemmatimonadaceae bacterium]|nr:hypothetical protein [Acetobacteraceae bacterium]
MPMRRIATFGLLAVLAPLTGCTGFGEFISHTFTAPGANPNLPMADSQNVRRALGELATIEPLTPEPGNVWPGPQAPEPSLRDLQQEQNSGGARGFEPTAVPGAEPG